jgi:hypothetical protein
VCVFKVAKIAKGIKKKIIKPLARNKSLCIFALGFRITKFKTTKTLKIHFLKIQSNEQKNVSTIEKKKKK